MRLAFLREHPLCVFCGESGRIVAADVVDHIRPHRGDYSLFWDTKNWQALCKQCHDSKKQLQENRGPGQVIPGGNIAGVPFDDRHHWRNG